MFALFYGIAILIALLAQTSSLLCTVGSGLRIDLVLLVVVYVNLFWRGQWPLVLGFLSGSLQDALSSEVLGLSALSKTLTAYAVQALCRNVEVRSLVAQGLVTCLAVVLDTLGRVLVMLMFQLNTVDLRILLSTLLQQTLLSLCLVPFVYRGLHALGMRLRVWQKSEEGPAV
jgi:rod shape-determining protein MreD